MSYDIYIKQLNYDVDEYGSSCLTLLVALLAKGWINPGHLVDHLVARLGHLGLGDVAGLYPSQPALVFHHHPGKRLGWMQSRRPMPSRIVNGK